jgi:hypothetical protein
VSHGQLDELGAKSVASKGNSASGNGTVYGYRASGLRRLRAAFAVGSSQSAHKIARASWRSTHVVRVCASGSLNPLTSAGFSMPGSSHPYPEPLRAGDRTWRELLGHERGRRNQVLHWVQAPNSGSQLRAVCCAGADPSDMNTGAEPDCGPVSPTSPTPGSEATCRPQPHVSNQKLSSRHRWGRSRCTPVPA